MVFLATLLVTAAPAIGAPYPLAIVERTPGAKFCASNYKFTTADPIEKIAAFYRRQAMAADVPLLDDSAGKFSDYRMLVFVREPKFLSVVLSRNSGRTVGRVSFHIDVKSAC